MAQIDGVMQALLHLEEVDQRLSDSSVSLDLGEMRVVIEVDVAGDDYQEGVGHAFGAIRTAIHAAGGATPEWSSDVVTRAHFEPQDFGAVPAEAAIDSGSLLELTRLLAQQGVDLIGLEAAVTA